MFFCSSLSFSRNSIYSIHESFYSFNFGGLLGLLLIIIWYILVGISIDINKLVYISIYYYYLLVSYLLISIMVVIMWINDFGKEWFFGLTKMEQYSLIYGIKLLILSELMLFFACFWGELNFRFIGNAFSLFFCFPLLSSYSFAIPYSNVIILVFSSLPIQSALILYKVGLFMCCIEFLSQTISCGIVFMILQIKEFFYSFVSISDCMIGSIFYFTTGLHGSHVFIGLLCLFVILINMISLLLNWIIIIKNRIYCIEYNLSLFLVSYYWHFVDIIWIFVFLVFFV